MSQNSRQLWVDHQQVHTVTHTYTQLECVCVCVCVCVSAFVPQSHIIGNVVRYESSG